MKQNVSQHKVICSQCGTNFAAVRASAKFCSPKCRVAAHRAGRVPAPTIDPTVAALQRHVAELGLKLVNSTASFCKARERITLLESNIAQLKREAPPAMSQADFRLVLGCLHSDRQSPELRKKYDKAFVLFKDLEQHLKPSPEDSIR